MTLADMCCYVYQVHDTATDRWLSVEGVLGGGTPPEWVSDQPKATAFLIKRSAVTAMVKHGPPSAQVERMRLNYRVAR